MLCGDVPWEGSSRRSVSLQGSLTREVLRASHGDKAQPSCWRETGVSLVARFVSSATWQTESGRSRTRAAGAPHVGGSSRSGLGVGGARAPDSRA